MPEVDHAHEHRGEGLEPGETQQEVIEQPHHARRGLPFPRVGPKRRLDGSGDARSLDALARDVSQNHAGAPIGQANEVIEVTAHQSGLGGRGIEVVARDAIDVLELVSHAVLECLGDVRVLRPSLARLGRKAYVERHAPEEVELAVFQRLLVERPQHEGRPALACDRTKVEQGTRGGIAAPRQPGGQLGAPRHGNHGDVRVLEAADQLVDGKGELRDATFRQVNHASTLVRTHIDGDETHVHLLAKGARGLGEVTIENLLRMGVDMVMEAGGSGIQALAALGVHGRDGGGELHGEVLGHRVQQARVVPADGASLGPAHLDDGDDMPAKPHGHADEARERRHLARRDAATHASVLVKQLARLEGSGAQALLARRHEAQAQRHAGLRHHRLESLAIGHELRNRSTGERARAATKPKAVRLREEDEHAGGVEGVGDLLQYLVEEDVQVLGVDGLEHDAQGAREASVREG